MLRALARQLHETRTISALHFHAHKAHIIGKRVTFGKTLNLGENALHELRQWLTLSLPQRFAQTP